MLPEKFSEFQLPYGFPKNLFIDHLEHCVLIGGTHTQSFFTCKIIIIIIIIIIMLMTIILMVVVIIKNNFHNFNEEHLY